MTRLVLLLTAGAAAAWGHDIITTPITFDREIARIIYTHCASCHHEGGAAFSLMTYKEARPWAVALKEEVLARRMPPWGAVKGFGDFRNDQALTPEQMELVVSWTDGGVPEGEEKDLPALPKFETPTPALPPKNGLAVHGDFALRSPIKLDGLWPQTIPDKASFQIVATLPDGSVQPLLWIQEYKTQWGHPFLLRAPLDLPKGTLIQGIPAGASVVLLKATSAH
ncbi:MAG TPA: cytochrome c [Bryobacteraceae bacterium]|jgi:hypothetical protein